MEINLPSDCGNSPRIAIVGDVVTHWAGRDAEPLAAWLADAARWSIVGQETHHGPDAVERVFPEGTVNRLEVASIVTHGRLASCDGVLTTDSGQISFSHVLRFAGATKTARIAEVRTYLVRPTD